MDKVDVQILAELDAHSRIPESEIAKKLKTSKQVIHYRIERLCKTGIIKTFQTAINLDYVGISIYANCYISLKSITNKQEKEFIDYLISNKQIAYIGTIGGKFDLSIVFLGKNLQSLTTQIKTLLQKFEISIKEYVVALRVTSKRFPKKYLYTRDSKTNSQVVLQKDLSNKISLDSLDLNILNILCKNSRKSTLQIAQQLQVPASTVYERFKKLKSKGVITGFPLLLDLKKISYQNYKLLIYSKDLTIDKELEDFAARHKNVVWYFQTLAPWNFELRVEIESQENLQKIIREIKDVFSNRIDSIELLTVFEEHKEDFSAILSKT